VVFKGRSPAGNRNRGTRGGALDPERSLASSLARTRTSVRRWCTHHRATRLATLTFATEPDDLDAGWAAIEGFRRRLTAAGIAQPIIVPEYGETNGRLHFHAAMPQYVEKDELRRLWGHGFTDIRRLKVKSRTQAQRMGGRAQARMVASYVAGYIAKGHQPSSGADVAGGQTRVVGTNRRRYSIPKATRPEPTRFMCWSLYDAWSEIESQCGHQLKEAWRSPTDDEHWRGPPTVLLMG
jgi:hypothetical protein